jgi:TRAP transporter TAXI family solute receptor
MTGTGLEISRRAFLVASAAALAAGCAGGGPRGTWRLAAGEPGGLYFAFAEILGQELKSRYPAITLTAVPTAGSVENLGLIRSGNVDMALAQADVTERDRAQVTSGTAPQAVAQLYEDYLQAIVRSSAPMQQFADLEGRRVSVGPSGSGVAAISEILVAAAGLEGRILLLHLRLKDALAGLTSGSVDAIVWSGGVPTPAIADLNAVLPLRMLDLGNLAEPMSRLSGYPYLVRRVPSGGYVTTPGLNSVGIPDMLLCRPDTPADLVSATVNVLATDAPQLMPPTIRGLQYLDPPSMIQTGSVPLHPGAVKAYDELHG